MIDAQHAPTLSGTSECMTVEFIGLSRVCLCRRWCRYWWTLCANTVAGNRTSYEQSRVGRMGALLTYSSNHMQPGSRRSDVEGTADWLDPVLVAILVNVAVCLLSLRSCLLGHKVLAVCSHLLPRRSSLFWGFKVLFTDQLFEPRLLWSFPQYCVDAVYARLNTIIILESKKTVPSFMVILPYASVAM